MTNQNDSGGPPDKTQEESSSQTPMTPIAPQKAQVSEQTSTATKRENNVSSELAREFRWVEFAQIGSNVVLAIVGIIALCIYNGQLTEMRKASKAAQDSADAATSAAKTADATLKVAKQQFRIEERPYIYASPEPAGPTINAQNDRALLVTTQQDGSVTVVWHVGIINSGKSSAKDVIVTKSETKSCPKEKCVKQVKSFVPKWFIPKDAEGDALPPNIHNVVPNGELKTFSAKEWLASRAAIRSYTLSVP